MPADIPFQTIDHPLCRLGEGPLWNVRQQLFYWTDIDGRTLWQYDPASDRAGIFWQGDMKVGGFAFQPDDSLVLFTDTGVFLLDPQARNEPRSLWQVPLADKERFNDITVDPAGRVFGGTLLSGTREGRLYRFERGRDPVVVLENIGCANGMDFSLDLRHFYHTDSVPRQITRYDYDQDTGDISNPTLFYQGEPSLGVPDGCTLDAEGKLWVACWGGGGIIRLDRAGQIERKIDLPARQCTSCMFGGKNLDTLYVTSAAAGAGDLATGLDAEGNFRGGATYHLRPGVTGRAEWDARLT